MLKEKIIKIEDKESADYGKSFKIKQAPVLIMEDMIVKAVGSSSNFSKINVPLNDIMAYLYFVSEEGIETQMINNRANDIIEDVSTLLSLRKEFIFLNVSFTRLVTLFKEAKESYASFTSIKK